MDWHSKKVLLIINKVENWKSINYAPHIFVHFIRALPKLCSTLYLYLMQCKILISTSSWKTSFLNFKWNPTYIFCIDVSTSRNVSTFDQLFLVITFVTNLYKVHFILCQVHSNNAIYTWQDFCNEYKIRIW